MRRRLSKQYPLAGACQVGRSEGGKSSAERFQSFGPVLRVLLQGLIFRLLSTMPGSRRELASFTIHEPRGCKALKRSTQWIFKDEELGRRTQSESRVGEQRRVRDTCRNGRRVEFGVPAFRTPAPPAPNESPRRRPAFQRDTYHESSAQHGPCVAPVFRSVCRANRPCVDSCGKPGRSVIDRIEIGYVQKAGSAARVRVVGCRTLRIRVGRRGVGCVAAKDLQSGRVTRVPASESRAGLSGIRSLVGGRDAANDRAGSARERGRQARRSSSGLGQQRRRPSGGACGSHHR